MYTLELVDSQDIRTPKPLLEQSVYIQLKLKYMAIALPCASSGAIACGIGKSLLQYYPVISKPN